jgi:Flp pilus assembly pilin Flp
MAEIGRSLCALAEERSGGSSIEYALIASIVAIVSIAALFQFGQSFGALYGRIGTAIQAALGMAP